MGGTRYGFFPSSLLPALFPSFFCSLLQSLIAQSQGELTITPTQSRGSTPPLHITTRHKLHSSPLEDREKYTSNARKLGLHNWTMSTRVHGHRASRFRVDCPSVPVRRSRGKETGKLHSMRSSWCSFRVCYEHLFHISA
ncbi:hypothetical protein R1flu_000273 [Riccia fluitans]|uniref:Secreted protein n=1 Tax=Riccia fluitans TaxID=41844 RepID=A0ABD1XZZ6_9MARC